MEMEVELRKACARGGVDDVRKLLARGADVERPNCEGEAPLHIASRRGHVGMVRLLLDRGGADLNRATPAGCRPLGIACENGQVDVATLLLDRGADVDSAKYGNTPLLMACRSGETDAVRLLLARGADVKRAKPNGRQGSWTALLHVTCRQGHAEAARLCLERGADVEANVNGFTPLELACQNGHADAARLCLDRVTLQRRRAALVVGDVQVWPASQSGLDRPLQLACSGGHVDAARLLLERGADIYKTDADKRTMHNIAGLNGHPTMAAWLHRIHYFSWRTWLSEPRYQLVVLRELVKRGCFRNSHARGCFQGLDEAVRPGHALYTYSGKGPVLDYLFPNDQPTTMSARRRRLRLPNDLFPLVVRYWWCGGASMDVGPMLIHGRSPHARPEADSILLYCPGLH